MNVLIKVHYTYNSVKCLQNGNFPVNYREYKQDPDKAAATSAIKWIKEIMKSFPDMDLTKVLYNEDIDITEEVKSQINHWG